MSDLNNRDPYNPVPPIAPGGPIPGPVPGPIPGTTPGPLPGGAYDQYGNARFEPAEPSGRGPYVLLGLLVAIGIVGGLVYFNHAPRDRNQQTAQAPISSTTTPAPAPLNSTTMTPPATPTPSTPSTTPATTPAPSGDVTK